MKFPVGARYIRLKNWERLQHQSDKNLPWIKFFVALLAPTKEPEMAAWPDHTKCLLYHLWLMARVHAPTLGGRIPLDWVTRERLNLKSRINLDPLLEIGSIWFEDESGTKLDLKIVSSRARVARSGLSVSTKEEIETYEREFGFLWLEYRNRIGKKAALRHYEAARKSGVTFADAEMALASFNAKLLRDKTPGKFVPHGSTWFNNLGDWIAEAKREKLAIAEPGDRPAFTV